VSKRGQSIGPRDSAFNVAEGIGARSWPPLSTYLFARSVVLVGLMGAGKSNIGRRLAHRLGVSRSSMRMTRSKRRRAVPFGHFRDLRRSDLSATASGASSARLLDQPRTCSRPAAARS